MEVGLSASYAPTAHQHDANKTDADVRIKLISEGYLCAKHPTRRMKIPGQAAVYKSGKLYGKTLVSAAVKEKVLHETCPDCAEERKMALAAAPPPPGGAGAASPPPPGNDDATAMWEAMKEQAEKKDATDLNMNEFIGALEILELGGGDVPNKEQLLELVDTAKDGRVAPIEFKKFHAKWRRSGKVRGRGRSECPPPLRADVHGPPPI
jgi:hypothetical protein